MSRISDNFCENADAVVAYLEGALTAEDSAAFEAHSGACARCLRELNLQKQISNVMRGSFQADSVPELPSDFSRRVSIVAEGQVSGLRDSKERKRFLALFAFAAVAAAALTVSHSEALLRAAGSFSLKALGLVPMVASFVQNLALGFFGVLRAVCNQALGGTPASVLALSAVFTAATIAFISIASARRGSRADKL